MAKKRLLPSLLLVAGSVLAVGIPVGVARGENIDPDDDDSQYAWGENIGWVNADLTWGVHVEDLELNGWMWGENVGWISLSCDNTASCGVTEYRVHNDRCGNLWGYAWGENVGWVNFSCDTNGTCGTIDYGVNVHPATGEFSGEAWGENVGWIRFGWDSSPYDMKTSWRRLVPSGSPVLSLTHASSVTTLDWTTLPEASGSDVVQGDLVILHLGGGLAAATTHCLANDFAGSSVTHGTAPSPGGGYWFLVRGTNCGGGGTYDSGGGGQVGPRDAAIDSSAHACP
jgi:hypothetical protein